ncbi:D-glycerate dehydrogenase, partial [Candidatus Woesearchaeota archaeon]|nr:D-glycerate dehydrogenase [Candidatus Woesearchaeota archaeon]
MKPKVLVTRRIPDEGMKLLEGKFELDINEEDRVLDKNEIIKRLKGKDALLCLLTDKIDKEVIESNPKIKVISNYAVGFDNVDLATATKHKIPVTNTPGVLTETTTDLAFALLMSAARRVVESDKYARSGKFKGWAPMLFLGRDVYGKTLGILGLGRIGHAMAKRASKGFDMKILYYDMKRDEAFEKEYNAKFVDKDTLLKESDFVSLHVSLTPETKHFIGAKELGLMKKTAVLINTSRGPVVDEDALVKALKEKKIFAAGLDVYEEEPKIHPGLIGLDNVVIVPHIASASFETRGKMAEMAAKNLILV